MENKIGIIIPTYNAETTIERCLDSITSNEELNKILNIFITFDGCTDNTEKIVTKYIINHENINIITIHHPINKGVAYSRNQAIQINNCKYTYFVDSDDTINADTLLAMYYHIENFNEDVVIAKHLHKNKNGEIYTKQSIHEKYYNMYKVLIQEKIQNYPQLLRTGVIWNTLIQTKILQENNLQFQDVAHDDVIFTYQLLSKIESFGYLPLTVYFYWSENDGLCNNYTTIQEDHLNFHYLLPLIQNKNLPEQYRFYIAYYTLFHLPNQYSQNDPQLKKFLNEIFKIFNKNKMINKLKKQNKIIYNYLKNVDEEIS